MHADDFILGNKGDKHRDSIRPSHPAVPGWNRWKKTNLPFYNVFGVSALRESIKKILGNKKEHVGVKDVCFKEELNFERKKELLQIFFNFALLLSKLDFSEKLRLNVFFTQRHFSLIRNTEREET